MKCFRTIGPEDSNKNDTEKPLHVKTDGLYSTPPSPSADTSASVDTEEENKKATVATASASKRAKEDSMKSLLQKAELMQTDFSAAAAVVKSSANQNQSSTADLMSPITPVGIREIDFANTVLESTTLHSFDPIKICQDLIDIVKYLSMTLDKLAGNFSPDKRIQ